MDEMLAAGRSVRKIMVERPHITIVPFPGGSGQAPTGAMQFQDDWPGLFIRGDDAIQLLGTIERVEQFLQQHGRTLPVPLKRIAQIIQTDVIVPGDFDP
jgi:hypothetical protein